jgi:hypothetical protein
MLMSNTVNTEVFKKRYEICKSCDFFVEFTKECSKNNEFLDKYILGMESECPIKKWN